MHKSQQSIYARNDKQWISVVKHRTGYRTAPNGMHFGGYLHGANGVPVPVARIMRNGVEVHRAIASIQYDLQYQDNDITQVRALDVEHIPTFYVRYNQIKELLVDLNLFINLRNIGFRRNYVANLGHQNLSNLQHLINVDYSDNGSLTEITFHPNAPINFYYLGGTSIGEITVDYMIQHAINNGIWNGTMTYPGRPTFDSIDNYATLVDRGWNMSLAPHTPTLAKFADTSAGVSNGSMIGASHKIPFTVRNANGTERYSASYSTMHPGDFPDFEENGWIEAYYHQPTILGLKFEGKQIKTLYLDHLISLRFAEFDSNNITSVNIGAITNVETLKLRYNPLGALNGVAANKITLLDVRDTNLGSTAIDQLLADLVAGGTLNGRFEYSVKPNPSSVGNYDILTAREWFLSIEPDRDIVYNATATAPAYRASYVNWDDIAGAEAYQLQADMHDSIPAQPVGTWVDTSPQPVGTTSEVNFVDQDFQPGVTYHLRVRVMIAGVWRNWEYFEFVGAALPQPGTFEVAVTDNTIGNQVSVSWTASQYSDFYRVKYRKDGEATWYNFGGNEYQGTSATITGLDAAIYHIYIEAHNSTGITSSNTVSTSVLPAVNINILSPTEGQEVTAAFSLTFEITGITGINMTNITEGQEVAEDFTINMELN